MSSKIYITVGHYGSGKTEFSVNYALELKKTNDNVILVDLDIVNPYFRTKDSAEELRDSGIRLIASEYAGSNVDIPALPQDMYSLTDDKTVRAVIDVGGDDRGALALGRISPQIMAEDDYEAYLVINKYRPLTPDAESTLEVMNEIETAGKFKFTGIINNSNLGVETTAEDVLNSVEYAKEVARATNLPLVATSVDKRLFDELSGKIDNLFALELQKKIN